MRDSAQNGPNSDIAWSGIERRRPMLVQVSPVDASSDRSESREAVAARQRPFATMLVGQSSLFLEGLKHIFDKTDFQVVALSSTAEELDLSCTRQHRTLLFILDAARDPEMTIRQIRLFKERRPDAFVAILIETNRMTEIASLFQAGANACFPKEVPTPIFLKSLELVMMGETLLPSSILSSICNRAEMPSFAARANGSAPRLSAQEERILRYLVEGHSNKGIARELGIADATVKVHVKAILKKIGAQNRTQAAIWATRHPELSGGARKDPPAPAAPLVERSSPDGSPSTGDECMITVSAVGNEADGNENGMVASAVSRQGAPKTAPRSSFLQQTSAWRSARRIAEENERRNAIVSKINQLRELRETRSLQAI
jgi:DNA-binding NarL/FixJ family response regulator